MLYQSTFSLPAVPFLNASQPQPNLHISSPPVQHILFDLLNQIIFSLVHTQWSSSLCNSLQSPVAFSLLGINISSSPYSRTLFAYVCPSIRETKFQTHSTQQTNYNPLCLNLNILCCPSLCCDFVLHSVHKTRTDTLSFQHLLPKTPFYLWPIQLLCFSL